MGKPTGFLEFARHDRGPMQPVTERLANYKEFVKPLPEEELQAAGRALHGLRHPALP